MSRELSLAEIFQLGYYWETKILLTAVKLDVFSAIDERPKAIQDIAGRIQADEPTLALLLNALVAMKLLTKEGALYGNSSTALKHLVRHAAQYVGHLLLLHDAEWNNWGQLEETIRTGRRVVDRHVFETNPELGSNVLAVLNRIGQQSGPDFAKRLELTGSDDIFTKIDAEILTKRAALPVDRILGVETGGCPHTAIREDASHNQEAIDDLLRRHPDVELIFLESGGDNLAATFSPELVDHVIYVIDVAGGDKIPRKGGPGITRSDFLVINKMDLAPHVRADLSVMDRDTCRMRGDLPFAFTNILSGEGLDAVVAWVEQRIPQRTRHS